MSKRSATLVLDQPVQPVQDQPVQEHAPALRSVTLTLRRVWPDGGGAYTIPGVKSSIYMLPGIFQGAPPPDTLVLSGLPEPVVKVKSVATAAAAAEDTTSDPNNFQ